MDSQVQPSEREELILQAVVHTYITTAEPVGSRAIVKRLKLDMSPATVRNVMADLEEAGFLQQLHMSSGRVPTNRGYRYYVDFLMRVQELTLAERTRIENELSKQLNDSDEVMRQTSHLLALVSHQAGIVEAPNLSGALVRNVELMPISGTRLAMLVADNYGNIRTVSIMHDLSLGDAEMSSLRRFLNDSLRGVEIEEVGRVIQARIEELRRQQQLLAEAALRLAGFFLVHRPSQLFLDGATQLFEQPEFQDVVKAREVFNLLDERERLIDLLRTGIREGPPRTSVVIGPEAEGSGLDEISVVASPYCVDGKPVGMVGVLGPRRMPYSRLTAVVEYTAGMLGRFLTGLAGSPP